MAHQCRIDIGSLICYEVDNEFWVKEYATSGLNEGRTYRVNFCPECGFQSPSSHKFKPDMGKCLPDDSIQKFSSELSKAIAQMNYNVGMIQSFMAQQFEHNKCFIDREMDMHSRINELEKALELFKTDLKER